MDFGALTDAASRHAIALCGGKAVEYRPAEGDPVQVMGLFDAQYVLEEGSSETGVEQRGPAVFLMLADLPTDPEQDEPTLLIDEVVYRVVERRPDGAGSILLRLHRAGA